MKPLAIDLYCGLGGWADGLLAEGYDVIGFDNERHEYGEHRYPGQFVVQDVLTLHGRQFKDADLIVASPPCTEYSYMAMPWSRAKRIAQALRGDGDSSPLVMDDGRIIEFDDDGFPLGYTGSRTLAELTELFDACFRIQREACEAAGRHVPLVVENVNGAQPWVGRARWHYGSYYLWGDVPALMPMTKRLPFKGGDRNIGRVNGDHRWNTEFKSTGLNWSDREKRGQDFTRLAGEQGRKNSGGSWFRVAHNTTSGTGQNPDGRKQPGISGMRNNGKGDRWFQDGADRYGSKSSKRKAYSALIAKVPFELARHIGVVYRP